MSESTNSRSGGIGFVGLLQVAFIVLKLCGVIDWSWWWVLSPTWISAILLALLLSFVAFCLYMDWRTKRGAR